MPPALKAESVARYKVVTESKASGATYTPKLLADFVAAQIVQAAPVMNDGQTLRLLDPATGDGELLVSLLEQLSSRFPKIGMVEVHGFDTDLRALAVTRSRIQQYFPSVEIRLTHGSFLEFSVDYVRPQGGDDLFSAPLAPVFDLVIANPPYVRTQIMGADQAQMLAVKFGLAGRLDMYYAFMVGIAHVLKPGGVGGVITSNRFMTTKSGGGLRRAIREHFNVRHVWDLGDTRLFDAAVLPAIVLLEKVKQTQDAVIGFTSIYANNDTPAHRTPDVISALHRDGIVEINDGRRFLVTRGNLNLSSDAEAVWTVGTTARAAWLMAVEAKTWARFGDIGKIRVGVKTCADKIFIRSDWDDMPAAERPELLRPLTTHHAARRFRPAQPGKPREILYPHESIDGRRQAIALDKFPNAFAYLQRHRQTLEARSYVIEGGRKWYEIWVPQDPASWAAPKLVFRDISEKPTFWMDLDGSIVNGDCYWLTTNKDVDLLWLAVAVANTSFIEEFYDHCFNNKLYSGRRRFITQYVERFPLPDPALPSSRRLVALAKEIYLSLHTDSVEEMESRLDQLVWNAFGVQAKKSEGNVI